MRSLMISFMEDTKSHQNTINIYSMLIRITIALLHLPRKHIRLDNYRYEQKLEYINDLLNTSPVLR